MAYFKCCYRTTYVNGYGNDGDDDDDKTNEERLFQNPTYDDTHTSPTAQPYEEMALQGSVEPLIDEGIPETKYDSVNLPTRSAEDDREMYDVLNRSQANGTCPCKSRFLYRNIKSIKLYRNIKSE